MPVFEYQGYDGEGRAVKGIIDADTARLARQRLRRSGIFPATLSEGKVKKVLSGELSLRQLWWRAKSQDLAVLTRQLSTLIGAGLPLVESLTALTEQIEDMRLKKVIAQVRERVNEGSSLAEALRGEPRVFSNLYVNMIRSGETGGALGPVLLRLADFIEGQVELKNRVRAALYYPIFMAVVGCAILFFLFTVVVPRIVQIFEELEQALPLPTLILIGASSLLQNWWWVILIIGGGLGMGVWRFIRTEGGRTFYDQLLLRLPVLGKINRMLAVSRFARTLSTLLASGVPLLTSIDIVKTVVNNRIISTAIEKARSSISEGEEIAEPLKRSGAFPPLIIHMIAVGEKSGELEEMLLRASDSYDNEVKTRVAGLTSLLEPFMILFMAAIVAFILISIYLPLLQMTRLAG